MDKTINNIKRKLPIGISDFKKLREEERYYIDKSLLIQKIWEYNADVLLLPRPRRFGKTLNLSMLRYFFEKNKDSNEDIFEGLHISKQPEIMLHQGQYPLIYLTFKDVKEMTWENCIYKLRLLLASEFSRHKASFSNDLLEPEEIEIINALHNPNTLSAPLGIALFYLMKIIHRATGQKIIVLIDEYDTPIHAGHQYGYYEEIILFIRNLLSGAFKDNSYLQKGIITGVLRISKESIFTGLNNISVSSITRPDFSTYFGFTEKEVEKMLKDFSVENPQEVKDWYNGYIFGKDVIYNPWSILNFLNSEDRQLQPFWIDSSSNDIVRDLILEGPISLRESVETLMRGESIISALHENIVLRDISATEENIWSLLTFSGYLKSVFSYQENDLALYKLSIPNREVLIFYRRTIQHWLNKQIGDHKLQKLLKALLREDIKSFGGYLSDIVATILSYHDTSGSEPERVYHAFVLGLFVNLGSQYHVRSNRERGYGRYDVMLIPKNPQLTGFIFEFKKIDIEDNETSETAMKSALKQIQEKKYAIELKEGGVNKIIGIGAVIHNKKVWVQSLLL
ncbi:MAG: AAA family ATPase [Desulfobacterales bacterium]|nr:AAA family ATPase [Desulfobacterales bacterium]MBF0395894.1 AAA family ATPase [Desulfobacterales bacterium]